MRRTGSTAWLVACALVLLAFSDARAQVRRSTDSGEPRRRAEQATERLTRSDAGRIVLESIKAHGGLDNWFRGRALRFRYAYRPVEGPPKVSWQTIDLLGSRAYHEFEEPAKGRIAWDGERAWSTLGEKFPAHFWSLTPYYFVAVPFVLGDPGVRLAIEKVDPEALGLPPVDAVRVTFAPGTGDAPDDYYVAYFAKDTHLLVGLKYVVTWKPFLAGTGRAHTPEKLVIYEDFQPAGPLVVARKQTFFRVAQNGRGKRVTDARVTGAQYGAPFDETMLVMPDGAVVDRSLEQVR